MKLPSTLKKEEHMKMYSVNGATELAEQDDKSWRNARGRVLMEDCLEGWQVRRKPPVPSVRYYLALPHETVERPTRRLYPWRVVRD